MRARSPFLVQLYTKDDDYAEPIARFDRARQRCEPAEKRCPSPSPGAGADVGAERAMLVLAGRALEIRDTVVISFLFLEKSHRTNDTASQSCADVSAIPPLSGVAGTPEYRVRDGGIAA